MKPLDRPPEYANNNVERLKVRGDCVENLKHNGSLVVEDI